MAIKHPPVAKAEMLIRKPVAEVFEAFVNPDVTSKFWFTKGSGKLEAGSQVRWDWEMYGESASEQLALQVASLLCLLRVSPATVRENQLVRR
jgi:uncharacterized protein YndB with AHSA1/START domain